MYKNSIVIIADIRGKKIIVLQNGKETVYPAVFSGKGTGNSTGRTPLGSVKLHSPVITGVGIDSSITGVKNHTGASIKQRHLESNTSSVEGRGVHIHGLPGLTRDTILLPYFDPKIKKMRNNQTHGCVGLTDHDAIALAKQIQSAPNAFMQTIA